VSKINYNTTGTTVKLKCKLVHNNELHAPSIQLIQLRLLTKGFSLPLSTVKFGTCDLFTKLIYE